MGNNDLEIFLAGYNVDSSVLEELKQNSPGRQDVTPEIISAAYARISRDPRPISELRRDARDEIEKARKSNSNIIFKMGHHSIAEHAVFNFDIVGASRLAVESIEHFRLNSFTEKSQRYITLQNNYVIPKEIQNTPAENAFIAAVEEQNNFYHKLNEKLKSYVFEKHSDLAKDPKNNNLLEGWAKEDARYITSLATKAQLGLTVNSRNLELMFRRFASQNLSEVKEISEKMFSLVQKIAPSIILFTEENDFDKKTYSDLKEILNSKPEIPNKSQIKNSKSKTKENLIKGEVGLINFTSDADDILISSLLYPGAGDTFENIFKKVKIMGHEEKSGVIKAASKHMKFYDSVLREFENINLLFEISLSASCFAQMKRHRMATIIARPYDPELGIVMPDSICGIKMDKEFKEIVEKTDELYYKLLKINADAAPYILTNAHKRRILISCNMRELYHISRLREDAHAQWDIQNISHRMCEEAKKAMPYSTMFIGGKDRYAEIYKSVFAESHNIKS